jgi:hypothetical protein
MKKSMTRTLNKEMLLTAGDTALAVTRFYDIFGNKINYPTDFQSTGNV